MFLQNYYVGNESLDLYELFVKFTVGLKPIEYDIISPLKVSKIDDKYIFFVLFPILNSVISVSYNL